MSADLGVTAIDQDPEAAVPGTLIHELEAHDNPPGRQAVSVEMHGAPPRPQHEAGVGVLVSNLEPSLAPGAQRDDDVSEVAPGLGEGVGDATTLGLGLTQPLGEELRDNPGAPALISV